MNETIQFLERFPTFGAEPPIPPVNPAIRLFSIRRFRNYIVVYLPTEGGNEVVRVLDGRRDLGGILDEI